MTLAYFLLARIAEDEDQAWTDGADAVSGWRWMHYPEDAYNELQARTIAAAKRTMADCKAKRQVVALHDLMAVEVEPVDDLVACCSLCDDRWPCRTLLHLASVYADHPDYRQEWTL